MRGLGGVGSAMFTVAAMSLLLNTGSMLVIGRTAGVESVAEVGGLDADGDYAVTDLAFPPTTITPEGE